jgi:hypothetical protein
MTDDDRRLAERLRRYESRVPVEDDGVVIRPRHVAWRFLAGAAAVLVLVVALGANLASQPEVGEASPSAGSPSADPVPSPSVTTPATASPTVSAAAEPSVAPSAAPTSLPGDGPIVRWAQVGVFASDGWATEVTDMTYAAGHFIAVGYREPDDQRGHVGPPIDEARIWISADGRTWEQLDLGAEFVDAHPRGVEALPDGSAVAYGSIDPPPPAAPRAAAWRSVDGREWTPMALGEPPDPVSTSVLRGPRGQVGIVDRYEGENGEQRFVEFWYSADGSSWEKVHELAPENGYLPGISSMEAGPEGFVVTGHRYRFEGETRDDRPLVLASGDGRAWFEAPASATPQIGSVMSLASIGGDWMILGTQGGDMGTGSTAEAWFSANGLAWERRGTFDMPLPANPYETEIGTFVGEVVNTGERVVVSGLTSICCHGPAWAAGVWSSHDGRSWERLGFPEGTVVSAGAEHDGVVVLGGFDRARPEDEFKARAVFWIGERQ